MSSDSDSLLEIGGSELIRHYPDRALLPSVNWYNCILSVQTEGRGLLGWLKSLEMHRFAGALSATSDGLRIAVHLENFVAFIPWPEATVTAERGLPATILRLTTRAVPSLLLEFHLDDAAADDLLQGVVPPLPQRTPPRRLRWPKPWAVALLVLVLLAGGSALALLSWSKAVWAVAIVLATLGVCLAILVSRPFIDEGSPRVQPGKTQDQSDKSPKA